VKTYKYKNIRGVYYLMNTSTESTEFKIIINNHEKRYEMYRIGADWTEDAKGEPCAIIEDDGNGLSLPGMESDLDYSQFLEWHLLFKFVYSYDKTMGDKYIIL